MTEYEMQAAEKVQRRFKRDFSRLVSDALAQLPAAVEPQMFDYLQVAVLECLQEKEHQESLDIMRTNYGTLPKAELPDFLKI